MKKWVLPSLLVITTTWAATSTWLYQQLKNNPKVIAVTTGNTGPSLPQENLQLSEMEKITFLRQYLDRFFNYDSNNFWQTQTSLSFLMAPELRDRRIEEVRRLREKIQQKNLIQKAQLVSLSSTGPNKFSALVTLQITESNQTSTLNTSWNLELTSAERTLENPWGLLVRRMDMAKSTTDAFQLPTALRIHNTVPLLLTLPCALENIESSSEADLKTKITTMNISEIQLTTAAPLKAPVHLKALCKDTEFSFEVTEAGPEQDLFKAYPATAGVVRKKEVPAPAQRYRPRPKDIYDKTIEKVLGIKLED